MFDLIRRLIHLPIEETTYKSVREANIEARYQMLRFADFWYYLGWVMYYEQAYVALRHKWEAQAYDPKNVYEILRKCITRK